MRLLQRDDYPVKWEEATDGMDVDWLVRIEEIEEKGECVYAAHGMTDDGCTISIFKVNDIDGTVMYAAADDPVWNNLSVILSHFAHHKVTGATISMIDLIPEIGVFTWPTVD